MHLLKFHKIVSQMISFFYRMGFWHRGDEPTTKELVFKYGYCIYLFAFIISVMVGAITSESKDESIFLTEVVILSTVLLDRLWTLVWRQNEILELLNRICIFSIRCDDDVKFVNEKSNRFSRFASALIICLTVANCCEVTVLPFIGSEKTLFVKLGFPLDYENNEIAFWIASFFIFFAAAVVTAPVMYAMTVWYLMLICSLRYVVLGNELTQLGQFRQDGRRKVSMMEKTRFYMHDLKESLDAYLHTRELINDLDSFCSKFFFIQLNTSGLCICGSVYCLAFGVSKNVVEFTIQGIIMVYNISEIFMITYFGNEIMLSSDRLSYKLYESDWYVHPQQVTKCVITFGECLQQPQVLITGKIYPLTLETFTDILNTAYSMFNILKNTTN